MLRDYPSELLTPSGESLRDVFYGLGIDCKGKRLEELPPIVSSSTQNLSRPIPNDLFYSLIFWGRNTDPDSTALASILHTLTEQTIELSDQYLNAIHERSPLTLTYFTRPSIIPDDKYLIVLEREDEIPTSKISQLIIRRVNMKGKVVYPFDSIFLAHSQTGEYLRIDPPNRRYHHLGRKVLSKKVSIIHFDPIYF